jgi:antitoxin FitA
MYTVPVARAWWPAVGAQLDRGVRRALTVVALRTIMEATGVAMPTNLTLKNVPDNVYERLKRSAEEHRRSLNSEAIVCLESVLLPASGNPTEQLDRIRRLRDELQSRGVWATPDLLERARNEGRP